jgi:hypothetical protein
MRNTSVIFLLFFFSTFLEAQTPNMTGASQWAVTHDGYWWNQQTETYKLGYLTGYSAAQVTDHEACFEHVSRDLCDHIGDLFPFGALDEHSVLARLKLFYEDPRNQKIIVELAIIQIQEDIAANAKTEYDQARFLEIMRQTSDRPTSSPAATPANERQIKLISDQEWPVGEAKDCSVDSKWMEAHCFPPTREGLSAKKHDYLVRVYLEKPLVFDKEGWAYNVVCRLENFERATCIQQARK